MGEASLGAANHQSRHLLSEREVIEASLGEGRASEERLGAASRRNHQALSEWETIVAMASVGMPSRRCQHLCA